MDEHSLSDLHKENLKMMRNFDRINRELGTTYYMACGTLLGAVRHKGFIPWDDDVDFWMPRNDFEMLIKYMNSGEYLSKGFRIAYDQPHAISMRLQLRICDYSVKLSRTFKGKTIITHPWIDVFALDTVTQNFKLPFYFITRLLVKAYTRSGCRNDDRLVKHLSKNNNRAGQYYFSYISEYLSEIQKVMYRSELFGEGKRLEFEGEYFYSPLKPEILLEQIYGDYMLLPPETERVAKHNNSLFFD